MINTGFARVITHLVLLGIGVVSRGEALVVRRAAGVTGGHTDRVHALPRAASRRRAWHLPDWRTRCVTVCSMKQPGEKRKSAIR